MPELPDVTVYIEALGRIVQGRPIQSVRVASPFVLRTYDPPIATIAGRVVRGFRRMGKRMVWDLGDELFLVIHLMIAGRLHWRKRGAALGGRANLAAFDFENGTLLFTERATKQRASLHLVRGEAALAALDPGGIEPLDASPNRFREALRRENRTLKRALTDPHIVSGVGNAYSDEILHRAKLSPFLRTHDASDAELDALLSATKSTLKEWTEALRKEVGTKFPEKVTAFRPAMAVHGKFGQPCPACATAIQRIVYADNESNYCPGCQTGGKLLADRALSRLLKEDWPRSLEEMETHLSARRRPSA